MLFLQFWLGWVFRDFFLRVPGKVLGKWLVNTFPAQIGLRSAFFSIWEGSLKHQLKDALLPQKQ